MTQGYVEIPGSRRAAPEQATLMREVAPGELIEISLYLKDRGPDPLKDAAPISAEQARARIAVQPREVMRAARTDDYSAEIATIVDFAARAGLSVVKQEAGRRRVKLSGTADKLEAAFRTKLHYYNDGTRTFRGRIGSLYAPADVAKFIEGVYGFDTRPAAQPKLARHIDPHAIVGHLPNDVARLYGFPKTPGHGRGQCVALIELGGGYRDSDNLKAFKAMGVQPPKVVPVSVSGGHNQPGANEGADGEVALDIQVVGGTAPGATIAVYFAPNTTQGFVDAITRAIHDEQNRPSIISISWGSPESNWSAQALRSMEAAFRDAARLGLTVFAASGDNLATDGVRDARAHVDYPSSSPYVVGCGGTRIDTGASGIVHEVVWNSGDSGTGGGISDVFEAPPYQANTELPASFNDGKRRRGVPDVAGDADPASGYRIVVGGMSGPIGGTSAVAPLWAGLTALLNEVCGRPAGFLLPLLYGNPNAFREVSEGDNKSGNIGYEAGRGWDACTGLGTPAREIVDVFRRAAGLDA